MCSGCRGATRTPLPEKGYSVFKDLSRHAGFSGHRAALSVPPLAFRRSAGAWSVRTPARGARRGVRQPERCSPENHRMAGTCPLRGTPPLLTWWTHATAARPGRTSLDPGPAHHGRPDLSSPPASYYLTPFGALGFRLRMETYLHPLLIAALKTRSSINAKTARNFAEGFRINILLGPFPGAPERADFRVNCETRSPRPSLGQLGPFRAKRAVPRRGRG